MRADGLQGWEKRGARVLIEPRRPNSRYFPLTMVQKSATTPRML